MSAEVIVDDHSNWDKVVAELGKIKRSYVKVGYLESGGEYPGSGLPMAGVAAVHEWGCDIKVTDAMRGYLHAIGIHLKNTTGTVHIPERSFMRSWADENTNKIESAIAKLVDGITQGQLTSYDALSKLGAGAQGGIQAKFRDNDWTPLKFREGTPLVHTGQLRSGIHFQVVES
jgi:phage gpG-like protein